MIFKLKPEDAEGAEGKSVPRRSALDHLTEKIIGAAIEVHRHTGPGLLESAYEECLCYELSQLGIHFKRQVQLPVAYKSIHLDCGYKMDLVVEDAIVLELKTVDQLLPIHHAQLLTYLKLSGKQVGLLINFNEPILKKGVKRLVNHFREPSAAPVPSAVSARQPGEERQTRPPLDPLKSRRLGGEIIMLQRLVNHFREPSAAPVPSAVSARQPGDERQTRPPLDPLKSRRLGVSAVK